MKNVLACIIFSCAIGISYAQNINSLIAEAEDNLEKNHWEQATKNFKSILDNYVDDLTYLQRAKIYNNLGFLHLQLLDPFESERYMNLSILYHEEAGIPNQKDYADALLNMGILYTEQVEFDLARRYIQKSLDILDELPGDKSEYWIARSKLAYLYEDAGSYTLALSIYNNCYDQLVASGNDLSPDFAEICMHKGRILILTGDPIEGEKFINLSTTIYESLGPQYAVEQAESMEHLAIFYERMGRYDAAEQTLIEVLRLKRSIPDEADILIIETLNDLGVLYHQIGNFRKASQMFSEVVKESEENVGTDHPFYATAKNNLGTLALASGEVELAREMFKDALTTYKAKFGTNHPYYANTLNNLARVERKLGNNDLAEKYYIEVLQIDEKIYGKNDPGYATTLINLGVLNSSMGREAEAEKYYVEAVSIREQVLGKNHPAYASALEYMGMHYLAVNNKEEAEKFFKKSVSIQIGQMHMLFPIMTEQERQTFYQNVKSNVDRYNYIAFSLLSKKPELAKTIFDFQLQTKDILFSTSDKVHAEIAESTDIELKGIYQKWQSDKRLLASYYQMGVQELEQQNVNLSYEEEKVKRQEKELVNKLPDFTGLLQRVEQNWEDVQESIREGEAFVEIVKITEFNSLTQDRGTLFGFTDLTKYLAIVFKPGLDAPEYAILGDDFKSEEDHYYYYKNARSGLSSYKYFWQPVDVLLENIISVKVSPDGIFHKLNPNILTKPDGQYIIDNYYVSNITSARDLFRDDIQIFNKKSYLFGNPSFNEGNSNDKLKLKQLPFSELEIKEIEGILTSEWSVKSYLKADANELKVRSAYNPTVLHIATHGFYNDKLNFIASNSPITSAPFRSGIFLSGASETFTRYMDGIATIPENDGILTTYEAMNLDLSKTKLVFLSGCVPAIDNTENTDGIFGLQKAFIVAGARNVITNLMVVNDQVTSELITLFYKKFAEIGKVDDSLKYAQLMLREKYEDPRIWGAFVLTGNG